MKLITTAVVIALFGVISLVSTNAPAAAASDNENNKQAPEPSEVVYNYVAQDGDSYSLIARKATQTYGAKYKVALSLGQIIYVETMLTKAANSPSLIIGQEVKIKEDVIKKHADSAAKLSTETKTAWEKYATQADFNTDAVGTKS